MKVVIQKVAKAKVEVEETQIAEIKKGFVVLLGITHGDTRQEAEYLANKISKLRVFEDQNQKMNLGIQEVQGEIIVVSQFTLYGDCAKGNRPSFTEAADPSVAQELYEYFIQQLRELGILTQCGSFGAHMQVSLCNDGPVTLIIEKKHE